MKCHILLTVYDNIVHLYKFFYKGTNNVNLLFNKCIPI